ncbi:class I SAM-dependent methyltransferase [Streptomyces sp. 549]|uniref:class I SAM-dependent methyltransferase n=1 Tax=Streptomyces sp. 549 TaxID=3049076 RepID=UPI0024C30B6B|nr:class I SAM-dependent methyltransferase [Streptomyces sp. 549]MDK1474489.1 class I SAM-dependent methyltransferase [Streptomyces sp. 549]
MSALATAAALTGLPGVAAWQLVPGTEGSTLLVAGPPPGEPQAAGDDAARAVAAAAHAGDRAVAGADLSALPDLMRLLDDTALLTMARMLDRARLFRDGARHDAAEVVAVLGTAPRHAWIVRRWLSTLTAEGRLRQDPGTGRHHTLTAPDRQAYAAARLALDEARRGLDYPASMTRFFLAAADRLPLLIQDRAALQEILFPDGETSTAEGNYRDSTPSRWVNHAAAELVAAEARRRPDGRPLRILEAGAGVGGTTAAVLDALGDTPVDYLFTDVSRFFLRAGREVFGDRPGMRGELFDINADPRVQGFAPASQDVVLAANVLHNARHAGRALAALRELLVPGGLLVLVESCQEHYQALTSMYLLMSPPPGTGGDWFSDLRAGQDRVFLTEDEWVRQLAAAGYRPWPVLPGPDHPLTAATGQRVIAGRAGPVGGRPDPHAVAEALAARLPPADRPLRVHAVDRVIDTTPTGEIP